MGLFEKIFGFRRPGRLGGAFKTMTAYAPAFRAWDGDLFESEYVRAAMDARARHISKLAVTITGTARPRLRTVLKHAPNEWMTWGQFLYRLSVILDMQGTAFIVPVFDAYGDVCGLFPVMPEGAELVSDDHGEPWLRYKFRSGQTAAVELEAVGIMTRHQYKDDIFGTGNTALSATMELINMQQQAITTGMRNSATFRFMAKVNNFMSPEDLAKERQRFNRQNLSGESGGILLLPNTYSEIKQLEARPFAADAQQMALIKDSINCYFGVNEDILQNKAVGDAWNAFYEGAIEPFAVQLSDVLTRMIFTDRERANGNQVFATSNRLQYMSNADKLNVSAQLADRGIMNRDEIREIWNLPPLPDGQGQAYIIRGEYKNANETNEGGDRDGQS